MVTRFMCLTVPVNDNFLYCEECNEDYDGDCPKHGALLYVKDAEVPANCPRGSDLGYSRATLPEGLVIKKSRIPKAGLGVFALKDFPARSKFGPFQGRRETCEDVVQESGYCWQILKNGKHSHYLDGKKPSESNWMRFVNCSRNEDEQCITAFQYKGEIFFRADRHIFSGNELLVYYGDSYAKEMGIRLQKVGTLTRRQNSAEVKKLEGINDGIEENYNMHFCAQCYIAFAKVDYMQKHITKITEDKRSSDGVGNLKDIADADVKQFEKEMVKRVEDWNVQPDKIVCAFQKDAILYVNEKGCEVCNHIPPPEDKTMDFSCFCDVCGVEFSNGCLQLTKVNFTDERPFKCNICDLGFTRAGFLEAHKRRHVGDKSHKCDSCEAQFADRSDLLRHRQKHIREKQNRCAVCGESFATEDELSKHKTKHSEERRFQCVVCNATFTTSDDLRRHEAVHARDRSCKCDVCGLFFSNNGSLTSHKKIHARDALSV